MNTRFTPRIKARAFTLVELLTVIAIIGILAAILIPTIGKLRATARNTQCVSNLRQWGAAVRLLSNDRKGLVALYNNLGAASATSDPKIYSPYFSQQNMIDPSGASRPSQEVMSRCPTAVSDTADSAFRKRCYAFGRPAGYQRLDSSVFGLDPGSLISCYNVANAANPARLVLMIETQSPTESLITVDNGNSSFTDNVRPMQTNTNYGLVRHGGSVNVLFLDGHVATYSFSQTDYSDAQNKVVMDQWFTL